MKGGNIMEKEMKYQGMKYTIAGRYMDGVSVKGYFLIDVYGNGTPVDRVTVEEMALNGQILNCTAQKYKGKTVMKGKEVDGVSTKLSKLPVVDVSKTKKLEPEVNKDNRDKYTIIARIVDKKYVKGYVVCDYTKARRNLTREKVIELAKQSKITNARVQMDNGVPILRGKDCDLASLPGIKLTDLSKRD